MHVLCCITLLVYACMTILHSLFQMLKFNSIVINAWPFYSLYSFIPPHPTPPLFIYSTVLVSVLFWVPCKVASWLKASPGEIRYPYHTIPYHTIPYHTIPYHTIPYHTIPYHTKRLHFCHFTAIAKSNFGYIAQNILCLWQFNVVVALPVLVIVGVGVLFSCCCCCCCCCCCM